MHGRFCLIVLVLLIAGCDSAGPAPLAEVSQAKPAKRTLEASKSGKLTGAVRWSGPKPDAEPFIVFITSDKTREPNPNLPNIDNDSQGVVGAVVFLRGLDAKTGRSWDHEPVSVEMADRLISLNQGAKKTQRAFVHLGDAIEMVNHDPFYHSLRAAGAAYFSLPFAKAELVSRRRLEQKGIVELSSAAGFYWSRAYLFVDDHPYYTLTDEKGHFSLEQVPPGSYQLVCWLPSWHTERTDRDPESRLITRLYFKEPVEQTRSVSVAPQQETRMDFAFDESMFPK